MHWPILLRVARRWLHGVRVRLRIFDGRPLWLGRLRLWNGDWFFGHAWQLFQNRTYSPCSAPGRRKQLSQQHESDDQDNRNTHQPHQNRH